MGNQHAYEYKQVGLTGKTACTGCSASASNEQQKKTPLFVLFGIRFDIAHLSLSISNFQYILSNP